MAPHAKTLDGPITSISGLFAFLEEFDDQDLILFRGQTCDWPLLPKVARLRSRDDPERPKADELLSQEQTILDEFIRRATLHIPVQENSDWDWLAIAQHHGLPTRLLDWSGNILAALWFAVREPSPDGADAVLWVYKPTEDDEITEFSAKPLEIPRTYFYRPKHTTKRIVDQDSYFTAHAYMKDKGGFVTFDSDPMRGGDVRRFNIPANTFANIRWYLDRCGVNAASLFADLDGLAAYIQWSHSVAPDE